MDATSIPSLRQLRRPASRALRRCHPFFFFLYLCVYVFICVFVSCIDKESEERGIFFVCVSSIPPSAGQREKKTKLPSQREEEKKKRKIQKRIFFKKKRAKFSPHARGSLCLRARTRELIAHEHTARTHLYTRGIADRESEREREKKREREKCHRRNRPRRVPPLKNKIQYREVR